jgi:hypothetical protein
MSKLLCMYPDRIGASFVGLSSKNIIIFSFLRECRSMLSTSGGRRRQEQDDHHQLKLCAGECFGVFGSTTRATCPWASSRAPSRQSPNLKHILAFIHARHEL